MQNRRRSKRAQRHESRKDRWIKYFHIGAVHDQNDTNTNDLLNLIPVVIDAAKRFDDENSGESQLASEHAEALANVLWLMSKEKVASVEVVLHVLAR